MSKAVITVSWGGHGDLIIIDADDEELSQVIKEELPNTFTVKTPLKGHHFYFYCKDIKKKIILSKNQKHCGEILSSGSQAVGPGCTHPETDSKYQINYNVEIQEVSFKKIYTTLYEYMQNEFKSGTEVNIGNIEIIDILKNNGVNLRNVGDQLVGAHPVHGSTTDGNFVVHPGKNVWHCFRCNSGGGPLSLIAVLEGLIKCNEAVPGKLRGEIFKKIIRIAQDRYGLPLKDFNRKGRDQSFESNLDIEEIENKIKNIPKETSKVKLFQYINPVLKKMALLHPVEADAILRYTVKKHFELNAEEIKKYDAQFKKYQKEAEKKRSKKRLNKEEIMKILSEEKDNQKIQPAQDYCQGKMVFAVKIKDECYLLTSDRTMIDFDDAEKEGFILNHRIIDTSNFSYHGIQDYIEERNKSNISSIYQKINDYIKRFIYFPDEAYLHYVSLWVIGTYLYMIFRYYPYVWLNAEKGSGKTLLMEVISTIAFNGELITSPTESVIFRDVSNNQVAMFIDEVEQLRKRNKDVYGSLISLLNAGFNKSGIVKRAEGNSKGGFTVKRYHAYSPKMFAGINDIDDVLQDRTVRIPLLRKKESELVERYKETEEIKKLQLSIRDALYIFALENGHEMANIYSLKSNLIEGLNHLNNRELDIWEPIFLLANVIDGQNESSKLTDMMEELSKKSVEEKQSENVAQNETYKVLRVLKIMLEDLSPIIEEEDAKIFFAQNVFEYFKEDEEFEWIQKTNILTRRLKKAEVKSEQRRIEGEKKRVYVVNVRKVWDLCERYNI